jgi:Fibronectin type III domain
MNKFKALISLLIFSFLIFSLTGGDCGKQTTGPVVVEKVAAPQNIKLVLRATSLDSATTPNSFAVVSWDASQDENNTDFRGYRIITVELNSSNQVKLNLEEKALDKSVKSYTVNDIQPMKRYKTFVIAELTSGTKSDSVATPVYAGIYYNTNGSIDSYTSSGNSQSGYGWDVSTGEGTQYTFNQANSKKIDLHLREESTGALFFKSPDFLDELNGTSFKYTKMDLIGYGQETFDETLINKPDSLFRTEAPVSKDGVYLLKTEEGNYIKVWVKDYEQTGNPSYFNVKFYYKVQPIAGLRMLKR